MNKFYSDLKKGQQKEHFAASILSQYFNFTLIGFNNDSDFDIMMVKDNRLVKFEVKTDMMSSITNNICIEYKYKGNPSGILKTSALYWVHIIDKEILILKTSVLKDIINQTDVYKNPDAPYHHSRILNGGDDGNSSMYLFNVREFKKLAGKKLLIIDKKLLKKLRQIKEIEL